MPRKEILIVIFLLINIVGFSQSRRFTYLTSKDGISQSEVYSFLKDSRGFVWFGTIDGLNRYDGYEIEVFNTKKNDPHALSNNTIRSLTEDHLGRIWIGTNDGLNMYDPKTELFYQIQIKAFQNQKLLVWSLLVYNGQLFVGTRKGLWRTNIQTNDLEKIESEFQKIKTPQSIQNIRSLIKSKKGGIWLLSLDELARIEIPNSSNETVLLHDFSLAEYSPAVDFREDYSGNLWICLPQYGLLRYNPETEQIRHFTEDGTRYGPSSKKCRTLEIDNNGNLWVGTTDNGLNFVKNENLHKENIIFENIQRDPYKPEGLNSNLIYSLYVSDDNNLWVGTIGSGVNIYNPNQKKFTHYKYRDLNVHYPHSNFIRSVYVDNENRLWTGTHNNGLLLFDIKKNFYKKLGFGTQSIFYIARYKENKKFICSNGLYQVELVNNKIKILSNLSKNIVSSAVFYVIRSKSNIYWIATVSGLLRAEIENDNITAYKIYTTATNPAISNNNCRTLLYDDVENELYLGTEGGGLNIIFLNDDHFPKKIEAYKSTTDPNSISNNYIRSIIKDRNQNLWIGTYEGLNKMLRDKSTEKISFLSFTKEDGLPNNMIQLVAEDNSSRLWIGTNGGLSQFIPEEKKFINYTTSDGIQSNEFSENCAFKKPDGEIIMGGINGISAFYPGQIEISKQIPQTTIIDFYLFNEKVKPFEKVRKKAPLQKSIVLTDSIFLLPKQNSIGFNFAAMIYPNADKVQYAYMLAGLDEEWQYTDASKRNASYTNLKHGDYKFMVKSTNNDGVWEETPREIFIHVKTPFYLTGFAFIAYGVLIITTFVYFSLFSVIRYAKKKQLLLEHEHDQKVHELDELRTKFFINISHDLRTPLTLIRGPLYSMLQNNNRSGEDRERLHLIKRNVKRLNYLVEQLLDVRKAESEKLRPKLNKEDIVSFTKEEVAHFSYAIKQKGLNLSINNKSEELFVCFDRAMLSKVYFNIISNAIKFADKGKIKIKIEKVEKNKHKVLQNASFDSFVMVEIRDSGKGIPAEIKGKIFERFYQDKKHSGKGYGIGLSHTKELVDAHQGFIEADSAEEIGTTIRFFLPAIEATVENESDISTSTENIYIDEKSVSTDNTVQIPDTAKTILIVEDNADMRVFIRNELKKEFVIIEASHGLEGWKKATKLLPDIIISDVMMPHMDGIELCEKIKSNVNTSHIPFILLTAKVDLETKYEGIKIGADDYIPKPFEIEYLSIRIKNLLESREKLRKLFQTSNHFEPSAVTVTSIDEEFLSKLIDELEVAIPDAHFSVSTLEEKMGMSHGKFYRKVKSLTGQSGKELLMSLRMKRAHQILTKNKELRVAEVAYMVGFTNQNYFSTYFKEVYGFPPSEING